MPARKAKAFTPREKKAAATAVSNSDLPQEALNALREVGEDVEAILHSCREVGMTRSMALALINRLAVVKAGYQPERKRITSRGLIERTEEILNMTTFFLDEIALAQASPKDLAIIFGIMVEKRQLLLGEPTQILSTDERKHINVLIPALMQEAQRRGMTIDLNPSSYKELGDEYKTARVIQPTERHPTNRKLLARKRD